MLGCLLIASMIPSVGRAQATAEARNRVAPPAIEAINTAMQKFVDEQEIAGAVTLVARDGEIVHLGAVGMADIANQRPMRPGTMFAIASMTKPIVATGVMILQDEGKLSIDDPVSKYLPAFSSAKLSGGESLERPITIRDVLTHTSGLGGNQIFDGTLEECVAELATRGLSFQPGTRWQYSPGLNVAGRIIEIVAKQPLDEFLQQRIFEPLRMRNTTFFVSEERVDRLAVIYRKEGNELQPTENFIGDPLKVKSPNPSGGLFSTARDLSRFYGMVLNGGEFRGTRIVSEKAVAQMTTPQTGDLQTGFTPGNRWGLGWCVIAEPQGVTALLSQGTFGHGGAFGTQGWVDPEKRTVHVLLIQRSNLPNADASDIRKAFHEAYAAQ
jgi:CubicO group peptidase (beta-lactamase class C family)